ncbi:hypothetical protein BC835DRAFT_1521969 [Cytidiella melzeri]|nr:hypothetical protein BC835DRAFT_1521969 [Cytidiella melzeri]
MLLVPSSFSTMHSCIAVALVLLATAGPVVSIPTRASLDVSPAAPPSTFTVAASGNDVDNTAARQFGGDQTLRRRGEPTAKFVKLLARSDRSGLPSNKEGLSPNPPPAPGPPTASKSRSKSQSKLELERLQRAHQDAQQEAAYYASVVGRKAQGKQPKGSTSSLPARRPALK